MGKSFLKSSRGVTIAVATVAVLGAVFGLGDFGDSKKPVPQETTVEAVVQPELPVSEAEEKLLAKLYQAMVEDDCVETAKLLNTNEKMLETMLSESISDGQYCYWEETTEDGQVIRYLEPLSSKPRMNGMVLTRFNTVFYGSFLNELPDGECHAIQAVVMDQPRYTFATGEWKRGKMDGEGVTGYHYYRNAPENGYVRTEKDGTYHDNLLEGEFVYRAESQDGQTLSWEMQAVAGVTVITEDWTHYPYRNEYTLGAEEDAERAYVLSEERTSAVIWNNLLLWDRK